MSSPNFLRPAVPPKPDKDKVSPSSISGPRGDSLAIVNPGMKQTVGTQVNIMMMRQPSPASSSGTSVLNRPDDLPRLKKPALPPKPRPPPINSALPKRPSSVQTSVQSPPVISTIDLKKGETSKDQVTKSEPAPVARIEELDNLSDLSLSPQSQVTSPAAKPPIRPPPRLFPPSPRSPPPPIPNLNNTTQNFNTTQNLSSIRGPPPAVPGNVNSHLNKTVFKFPASSNVSVVNTSKIFNPNQIQLRQAKSASLGRSIIPPSVSVAGSAKKSSTLSRVSPLDLSWNTNLQNQFKPTPARTAPVLTGSNNRPVNFPRPITFAAESKHSLLPPPPPPRQRKNRLSISSSGTSPTSPLSPGPGFTSQTDSNSQISNKPVYATVDKEKKWAARLQKQQEQSHHNNNTEEISDSQPRSISFEQDKNSQELVVTKEPEEPTMETEEVIKSSLTITPSWLGRLIEKEGSGPEPHESEPKGSADNEQQRSDQFQGSISALSEVSEPTNGNELKSVSEQKKSEIKQSSDPQSLIDPSELQILTEPQTQQHFLNANITRISSNDIAIDGTNNTNQMNGDGLETDSADPMQKLVSDNGCTSSGNINNSMRPNNLCKNESFLFAMQESNELIPEADKINNSSEEVSLSKTLDNDSNGHTQTSPSQMSQPTEASVDSKTIIDDAIEVLKNNIIEEATSSEDLPSQQIPPLIRQTSLTSNFETTVDVSLESFNQLSTATFTESDVNVSALRQKYSKPDPNAVLQVADSQLQRFQNLLQDFSHSKDPLKKTDTMGSTLLKEPPDYSEDSKLILDTSKSLEDQSKQLEDKTGNSDRDIVSAILLSKFEKKGFGEDFLSPDLPNDEDLKRRSWNTYSDASISPSESSSSSCSHIHQSGLKGSHYCHYCRRKQASSWADEDESTGVLGDAESSDQVPSSTEEIGSQIKLKKKRSSFSLFGSFGKSGADGNPAGQRRSQFFLDSVCIEPESNGGVSPNDPGTNGSNGKPHPRLERTSGLFTSVSSGSSFLLSPIEVTETDSSRSSMRTITPETPEILPKEFDEILDDLTPGQKKSFFVAREILTSERTFVDVLNLLTRDFPTSLEAYSESLRMPVIGKTDLDIILGGLPILKAVNEVLVSELEVRISKWRESPKVADIIVRTGPFLKHYATYVRDFERIMQKLDGCCGKYPAFAKAVKDFEGTERCQKLGLRHYMLKPVQRMPQYRLLLEDYLKTLTEESEDYQDTIKAIAIVKEVAEHANEAINLQINAEKLVNLQNRLPNTIVLRTNRFLIKEGELLKVCRKELQPRYFALMTDCLLCMTYNASTGAPGMKDLKLRYELPLTGMRISTPPSEDYLNEFSVISNTRSFNLVAKSARDRDDWMKSLSTTIQDNIRKRTCTTPDMEKEFRIGAQAPVWIQDKRVTMCQVCTAEFTVTFRRHHCRACGKVVCGNCSGNQAPLVYKNNESARVCDECYQYLLEEFDKENSERDTMKVNEIRSRFKKLGYNTTHRNHKQRRSIPDKFKIQASSMDSQVMGYLQWREKERKPWKRNWFALKDRVLYVYAASEDIVASRTMPVLGYEVQVVSDEAPAGNGDGQLMFKLTHSGQSPILFQAENPSSAEKWITALQEATVLT